MVGVTSTRVTNRWSGVLPSSQVHGQLDHSPSLSHTIPKGCFSSHPLRFEKETQDVCSIYFMIFSYRLFWCRGTTEH